jgi:acid phosphatase (class A)
MFLPKPHIQLISRRFLPYLAFALIAVSFFVPLIAPQPALAALTAAETKKSSYYLTIDSLPPTLLTPPPADGSPGQEAQIEAVIVMQDNMPKSDLAAIKDEQHMRLELMTKVIGNDITHDGKPKTWALLDRVLANTRAIVDNDKKSWHTKRPYLMDHRVKLLVDPIDDSPAYPSGHTTETHVLAEVLGMLYPDKLKALRARADAISRHRIEAGAHYPIDVEAGKALALLVVGGLTQSDDFQDDLLLAKQENNR